MLPPKMLKMSISVLGCAGVSWHVKNTFVSNSAIEAVATRASRRSLRKSPAPAVVRGYTLPSHVAPNLLSDKPCQSETFLVCDCQRRKQKVKCLSTRINPEGPQREPLKCDDECARQKRNRQLAEALNVEPDHTDDHIPYQATTLKLFRDNTQWAQTQEREFRVFAESNLRNMRFKPMKPYQRQFLHALAEDFGLDSESQDPEPHRHVSIFKGPRFVSAPRKTLMQCVRIAKAAAPARAEASSAPKSAQQPYNALLISRPRFGLTIEELDSALAGDLAAAVPAEHRNNLTFATSFLPTDEVLIRATTKTTAATIASGALAPAQVESLLAALKSKVAKAVAADGLAAGGVVLCTADPTSLHVLRREGDGSGGSGGGGWSQVARGAAARPRQWAAAPVIDAKVPGAGFVALRRLGARKQENRGEVPAEE
ncbi:FKBP12-associated protein [Diaporthe eres]|uniref:FKBP12-associated protein n=1 Tax=Diaporthe eres TaxID=83184 RepID=A0ABR1PNF5_DIAER